MRAFVVAACLLLTALAVAAPASAGDADLDAWECYGVVTPNGFTGTCTTPDCGYIIVEDRTVGYYGPCVSA